MRKQKLEIAVLADVTTCETKKIAWSGHVVAGTDRTIAVTRPARRLSWTKPRFAPRETAWTVTHIPTGCAVHRLEDEKFAPVLKRAKQLFRILKKHDVHTSTDPAAIADKCRIAFLEKFG